MERPESLSGSEEVPVLLVRDETSSHLQAQAQAQQRKGKGSSLRQLGPMKQLSVAFIGATSHLALCWNF